MNITNNLSRQHHPPFDASKIDPKYKCPVCKNLMLDVHQADDCGCRYCLECLENNIFKNKKCIQCNFDLVSNSKIPDKFFQKRISKLTINCVIQGCKWSGPLSDYAEHYNEHFEKKSKKCEFCSFEFKNKEDLDKHLAGNCLKQPVQCVYESIGCVSADKKALLKENLEEHLSNNLNTHLRLMYEYFSLKLSELESKKSVEMSLNSKNVDSGYVSKNLSESPKLSPIEDSRFLLDPKFSKSSTKAITSSTSTQDDASKTSQLINKIDMLQNTQNGLITDINKLVKANDKLKQENTQLKDSLKEYKLISQELHKTLALTQVSLLTLEERLINQEKLSYDGCLLWKITNVHERMQEAKSGRQTSFYSPPFYTNRNGYKMCARIYLNGDGNGRNTHLSLFFVILRGENDALLRWPFRQKVTFILIDQSSSESRENVYDAFRPDPNSSSFRRPVSDMNIASGLPVFCPLGKLMSSDHEYIKDNSMFIKIIVDIKDLPEV